LEGVDVAETWASLSLDFPTEGVVVGEIGQITTATDLGGRQASAGSNWSAGGIIPNVVVSGRGETDREICDALGQGDGKIGALGNVARKAFVILGIPACLDGTTGGKSGIDFEMQNEKACRSVLYLLVILEESFGSGEGTCAISGPDLTDWQK